MNSLNILSGFSGTPASTPPSTPPSSRSRTGSSADPESEIKTDERDITANPDRLSEKLDEKVPWAGRARTEDEVDGAHDAEIKQEAVDEDERTPLLSKHATEEQRSSWRLHRRLAEAIIDSAVTVVRVVYTALSAPKRWVVACFYNDQGQFSAVMPFRQFRALMGGKRSRKREQPMPAAGSEEIRVSAGKRSTSAAASKEATEKDTAAASKTQQRRSPRRSPSNSSMSSATTADMTSEGEPETDADKPSDSPSRNTRSKTPTVKDEINPQKKSIRIKLHAPTDTQRQHRQRPQSPVSATTELAQSLKSPIAPPLSHHLKSLTRYPRLPTPPRPLVPRRQPSYSLLAPTPTDQPRKTLVIDLDETLIHSMAKGGRMSQGHMVEVRLTQPTANPVTSIVGSSGVSSNSTTTIPILYYVHERPYVHDFLRKVAKWYNLVIFTASVQEYADPVIDYLERERKYFSARYYRQHCTWRAGAYVKDLGVVEGDLGRVLILDNSPMSYVFHEDNALPIEGWISDPTDRELLHLIALLEGLQYAIDIGHTHGSLASTQIHRTIAFYKSKFLSDCKLPWPEVLTLASKSIPTLDRHCPALAQELHGVADGANVKFEEILALNVRTEIVFGCFGDGCTALSWKVVGKDGDGESWLAQNWDWQPQQGENLIQLTILQEGKPGIKMITEAGLIGKIGFNDLGVGVCLNAVKAKGVGWERLPVHLALRLVLESQSKDEALRKLQAIGVAAACHMLIADATGGVGVECSHIDVKVLEPDAKGRVFHSNHFLIPHGDGVDDTVFWQDSLTRVERIRELADGLGEVPTRAQVERVFRDEQGLPGAICRAVKEEGASETLFSIVMELKGRKASVIVGRPTEPKERFDMSFD
ncbi:hypothetical protein B0A48_11191 [Cryoendolithus antarcticus]|uniref:FCP1 homology domain-containing protein n=1 Tax=Cryoendolithus antarcticus TaxID=1507870 RepID=A0A1V8SV82_9PEZI|nr:hypothetical protein B0A48_11191 [Cryoendolithus antarcticus]